MLRNARHAEPPSWLEPLPPGAPSPSVRFAFDLRTAAEIVDAASSQPAGEPHVAQAA